ncbi:MAG: glycosyltransferase [Brevinematia bacterium]
MIDIFFIFLALLGFLKIFNFYYFNKNFKYKTKNPSLISIIIPARNEEKRLENLLKSIPDNTKYPIEIIIVDDNSIDNTLSIAKKYGAKIVKVKDFFDEEGKNIACYTGALNSKGDYLLFIDADVFFENAAFDYIFKNIPEDGILTIQPYHQTEKFYEQFSLYSNLIVLLGLDIGKIKSPNIIKNGYFGPFFLIKREDYFKIDGHNSIKNSIIEDMELGKKLAEAGLKIYSIPHKKFIKFRMYPEGFKSLVNGWTKNMASGAMKSSISTIIIITGIFASSLIIPINLVKNIIIMNYFNILLYVIFHFLYSVSLFLSVRNVGNFKFISCFLYPVFSIFYIFILLSSFLITIFNLKINWRGRRIKIR